MCGRGSARRTWQDDTDTFAGSDPVGIVDEKVPSVATRSDNRLVAVPHAPAELIAAQVVPDVLHRVELRQVRRQRRQRDAVRHAQPFAPLLAAFADVVVSEQEPIILRRALRGSFWRAVWPSMLASLVYTLLLIGTAIVSARAGIDLIGIIRNAATH